MMLNINSNSKTVSKSIYLERMSEPCLLDEFEGIYVGKSITYKIPFLLNLDKLINKNIAILGMSGSGKSYFLKSFIIRSNLQRGSSILIIDWNNEYSETVAFLGGKTLTLGTNFRINIFDLYELENVKNIKNVSDVISNSINLNEEENYSIYNKVLSMLSYKLVSALNLSNLINELRKDKSVMSRRLARKLLQLKSSPMFAEKTEFPIKEMLNGVISIDFSTLKDDNQRNEISKSIFRIIIELMHSTGISGIQKVNEKIIVLDEAWRLIKNSEDVGVLFREGRKYGFCVAVATQLANDINNEVLSNSACLILFRLQNDSDYKMLVDCGIINEKDKNKIANLSVGSCLISMVLKENSNIINKFLIESTDGIVSRFYFIISGGKMQNRISHRLFTESTKKLQTSAEVKEKIINFLNENNNEVEDIHLIRFMLGLNISRAEIFYYLRLLGLKDIDIAVAFDNAAIIAVK